MKNKLGMNLLLWGTKMNKNLVPVLEMIKEVGYDTVEVPIMDFEPHKWEKWRKELDRIGLSCIAETMNGPQHNSIASDAEIRQNALVFNKKVLDCAHILGADLLIGPIHSAIGVFSGTSPNSEEKKWAAENLFHLACHAEKLGITLGLEYLNRFESYLVSSTDELLDLNQLVRHTQCKVMFDTFHANIEEKDLSQAIEKIADQLVHVQLSENDRGTLGHGHINFPKVIAALRKVNYQGCISVEAFSQRLPEACIWRQLFETEEQLSRDSYNYLYNLLKNTPEIKTI